MCFYFLESIIVVATKANLCAASSRWLSSPGAGSNMVTTKSRDIWKSVTQWQGDKKNNGSHLICRTTVITRQKFTSILQPNKFAKLARLEHRMHFLQPRRQSLVLTRGFWDHFPSRSTASSWWASLHLLVLPQYFLYFPFWNLWHHPLHSSPRLPLTSSCLHRLEEPLAASYQSHHLPQPALCSLPVQALTESKRNKAM